MKQDYVLQKEFLGTVFDRQVRIQDWSQKTLSSHTALCLGVGGLGSFVVINLLRLGIKKIIVVDYDKVDNHNLNRQILYGPKDVGLSKINCCIRNAEFHNIGNTEIVGFQGCVLQNWQKIIGFARQANVVFNMIDYGDWFDLACQSLCLKLGLPMIQGGTFGVTMTVDYFSPQAKPCALCLNSADDSQMLLRITPDKIQDIQDLKFLPQNNNPTGRSFVGVCAICAQYMVCLYLNSVFFNEDKATETQRLIFYTSNFQIHNFPLEGQKNCVFCGTQDKEDTKTPGQLSQSLEKVLIADQQQDPTLVQSMPQLDSTQI